MPAKYSKPSGASLNRGDKARILFETGKVHPTGRGDYRVASDSQPGIFYRVGAYAGASGEHWECTCHDYRWRAQRGNLRHQCKHIGATFLYRAAVAASVQPHELTGAA